MLPQILSASFNIYLYLQIISYSCHTAICYTVLTSGQHCCIQWIAATLDGCAVIVICAKYARKQLSNCFSTPCCKIFYFYFKKLLCCFFPQRPKVVCKEKQIKNNTNVRGKNSLNDNNSSARQTLASNMTLLQMAHPVIKCFLKSQVVATHLRAQS